MDIARCGRSRRHAARFRAPRSRARGPATASSWRADRTARSPHTSMHRCSESMAQAVAADIDCVHVNQFATEGNKMLSGIKSRGADAIALVLKHAGVKRIFTLSGNHIMSVFDSLIDSGIDLIHTRHEAAAVHMADAFSRLTGEPAIALVTGGPGHANAVSALYTAQLAESPIILLSGHAPNSEAGRGAFQEMPQADMARTVSKAAWTCRGSDALAPDLARALRLARSGRRGPVNLNLPSDALDGTIVLNDLPRLDVFDATHHLDPGSAKAIIERLGHAARPLILA